MICIKSPQFSDRKKEQWVLDKFHEFLELCGIEESRHKATKLSHEEILCGLHYRSTDLTVAPTVEKRYKCITGLIIIVIHQSMYFKPAESLLGTITWIASTCYPMVAFLRRLRRPLIAHRKMYGEQNTMIHWDNEDVKDCKLLIEWLYHMKRVSMLEIANVIKRKRIMLYTDGATNGAKPNWNPGLGAYCQGEWFSVRVPKKWNDEYIQYLNENKQKYISKETNIAHFEALAIVTALNTFKHLWTEDSLIDIRCDNKTCCSDFANKNSDDILRMDCVRWLIHNFKATKVKNIRIEINYIHTKRNYLSDACSRFNHRLFIEKCKQNGKSYKSKPTKPIFPELGKI